MSAADARRAIDLAYGALSPVKDLAQVRAARKHLIAAKDALTNTAPAPAKLVKGAICVIAGNMNVDLLREAGITHVAVELTNVNGVDFGTSRWQGFTKGWYVVSRGNDGDTLANAVRLANVANPDVTFTCLETESHKTDMGGSRAWTDTLYSAMRSKLGKDHPLYNITFGLHASPEVVNYIALERYNVQNIEEAYDEAGRTHGVQRIATKARSEGRERPHIALGDKTLVTDVVDLKAGAAAGLGGVWLWAPDNGPAQEALAAGIATALRGIGA